LTFTRLYIKHNNFPIGNIKRSKPTRSQTGLSAAERKKNLRGAFTLPDLLTCRHPLIVDDVITTGATVTQLAQTLLRAGAETVSVLAVARAGLSWAHDQKS